MKFKNEAGKQKTGVPAVAQQDLRYSIPGPEQWVLDLVVPQLGCSCGSDLIPGPVTPYAAGQPKKKKKILKDTSVTGEIQGFKSFPPRNQRQKPIRFFII